MTHMASASTKESTRSVRSHSIALCEVYMLLDSPVVIAESSRVVTKNTDRDVATILTESAVLYRRRVETGSINEMKKELTQKSIAAKTMLGYTLILAKT